MSVRVTGEEPVTSMSSFDYIVVGAGTAGCVVAARLSGRGSVLLLEAGGPDTDAEVDHIIAEPRNVLQAIWNTTISKRYLSERQPGLDHNRMMIHQGTVRGGGSAVNGMIYVRGNRRDYDLWAQMGNRGWSFEEVLPYFRRSENYAGGASAYHGAGGPLDVCRLHPPSPAALAFIDAAGRVGFPSSSPEWDFNGPQQENAAGLYHTNVTRAGRRASAGFAFLNPVAGRPTLVTKTHTRAVRIIVERGRAVGVQCLVSGTRETFRAEREVIVSAGTFESPKLLMLSGIGPADHIRAHGIAPVVDVPGVGQNLHDHLQLLIYHFARRGAGQSVFTAEAGLFLNTRDRSRAVSPDLQFHVLAGMPGLALDPVAIPNFLICPVLCKPQSRGTLSLRSSDPTDDPLIEPNYLQCEEDMQVLFRGIELAEDLARAGALGDLFDSTIAPFVVPKPLEPNTHLPLPRAASDRAAFVKVAATTVWHPVGTCKMGLDHLAVVDPRLRVYGVDGLRVADGSIMPFIPSGNTNAVCFMIGEMCADAVAA